MFVFGGLGAGPVNDMWCFDLTSMRWVSLASISGRRDCQKKRLPPFNPPSSQGPVHVSGPVPSNRSGHTFTTDPEGKIWLFGGQAGAKDKVDLRKEAATSLRIRMLERRNVFNDVWIFDPAAERWQEEPIPGMSPSPRRGHTATLVLGRRAPGPSGPAGHAGQAGDDEATLTSAANPNASLLASLERSGGLLSLSPPRSHVAR